MVRQRIWQHTTRFRKTISSIYGDKFKTDEAVLSAAQLETSFLETQKENKVIENGSDVKITDPFNLTSPNFQPMAGSPVYNASYWYKESEPVSIDNNFFDKVSYVGAFDGYDNWTEGWTNWSPVDEDYSETYTMTKGNGQFTNIGGVHIVADETWSGVVKIDGWIYVDNGATLTIEPGTIIRGTNKSVLIITPGGKIMAAGTRTLPIVFTSSQGAGFRSNSDWGGLVICGKAPNNLAGGVGIVEGGVGTEFGGSDPADNSGVLTYVRIEFPGFEVATGSEINGLTLGSVGSATRIENIQVSYSGDDGYEFFGGTVNAKYLISYRTEDDDFDTDNGYSGMVQFGIILRDPSIVDSDTANGFESDNDKDASVNTPFTQAIFSNISGFGSAKDLATYNALPQNHKEGSSLRIRKSSRISVYNSLFMGWGRGLRFESTATHNAAAANDMTVKNTFISSIYGDKFKTDDAVLSAAQLETWFLETQKENKVIENGSDVKITDPFNLTEPNFQPMAGSPVYNASYWSTTPVIDFDVAANMNMVRNYPNPFKGKTNIEIHLRKSDNVRIVIFNISGAVVTEIQNGQLYEGTYDFIFDASQLPGGLYFGKVIMGNEVQTLKMMAQ
ncbi:MAG: T9SS type A sorting domain-containing protein [Draconibacterium sp.]|nr:T9SS type A sorting domain-containing protein [Draconibacterium sp.]